jgi:hypothetical protein
MTTPLDKLRFIAAAVASKEVHGFLLRLLCAVADFCAADGSHPGIELLAAALGVSMKTVQRGLDALVELGWLLRLKRGGGRQGDTAGSFALNMEKVTSRQPYITKARANGWLPRRERVNSGHSRSPELAAAPEVNSGHPRSPELGDGPDPNSGHHGSPELADADADPPGQFRTFRDSIQDMQDVLPSDSYTSKESESYTESETPKQKKRADTGGGEPRACAREDPPNHANGSSFELTPEPPRQDTAAELCRQAIAIWNAAGLPRAWKATDDRIKAFAARFRDDLKSDMNNWRAFCQRVAVSDYLTGRPSRRPVTTIR